MINAFINRLKTDDMARHGIMMAVFVFAMGVFNYFYQLLMGIMLPTAEEYGTLFSLTSIFAIIMIFVQGIQTSMAKFASKLRVEDKWGQINYLWRFSLKRTLLIGLVLFLVSALISPLISRFLNIDSYWYLIILFSSFVLAFALPANWGLLQGLQRFLPLGFSTSFWAFSKLGIAALLVYLGLGVGGGLLAFLIAYCVVFALTLIFLKDLAKMGNERYEGEGLFSYTGLVLVATLSFAMLTNFDIILAKHYLSSELAGNYSVVSVLGKVALYAPAGVAMAMFPKTSESFETGEDHRPLLIKAMLLTLLLAGTALIIYALFPNFIINLLFSEKYPFAAPYLFKYGLAMFLFAISFLLMNYFLSLNQTKVAFAFMATMVLQIGLVVVFHSNIGQIVNVVLISGGVCIALMVPFYLMTRKKPERLNMPTAEQ